MTNACYIINTNQHQHKLHNSKKIARNMRAIYPKIPSIPETLETPDTPDTPDTLETVSHPDSNLYALVGRKPAVGADLSAPTPRLIYKQLA